jgi:hypothetical protein
MPLDTALHAAIEAHAGLFACSEIHHSKNTRQVAFRHQGVAADPALAPSLPDVPGLRAFYATYAELTLYLDEASGDAAYRLAPPSEWAELDSYFRPWLEGVSEEDADEYLPDWIADCLVVGEIPHSGNYLLLPTRGADAGKVFEFEHDGFEFIALGASLADFVRKTLDLDPARLTAMASHMRFITPPDTRQWWIEALEDNRGNQIRTEA